MSGKVGKIVGISGPTVRVALAGLKLYDRVTVGDSRLNGEVIRLEPQQAVVQVYEDTRGLSLGEPVAGLGAPLTVRLGPGLLEQIFDGLQRPLGRMSKEFGPFIVTGKELPALDSERQWHFTPLKKKGDRLCQGEAIGFVQEGDFRHFIFAGNDCAAIESILDGPFSINDPIAVLADGRPFVAWQDWPVRTPRPYKKKLPSPVPIITGQRVIDFFFPLAQGGTAIFPGGFGTGKTILEQTITKFANAEVVIYVGCGERGNEMAEMLQEFGNLKDPWSGRPLAARTIMVVNTSNMPVAAREASIYTAATMAEYYRDMGYNVLFLADSISRWAEALREISSALEEMPGEEGYPTALSSRLASFFARAGTVETVNGKQASLSMILSVSPPGGDFTEPVTQGCLRAAGAFLMLDARLAHSRHFPAINWSQSYSLYEGEVTDYFRQQVDPRWSELRNESRKILQREEKLREVAEIVGAEGLQDEDHLLMLAGERIRRHFLSQNAYTEDAFSTPEQTFERIAGIIEKYREALRRISDGAPLETVLQEVKL